MSKILQYETLAKYDPNAKDLLDELKSLKNDAKGLPQPDIYDENDDEDRGYDYGF